MIKTTINQKDNNPTLKELDRHKILCTNCGKLLGYILEIQNNKISQKTKKRCGKFVCKCVCGYDCFAINTKNDSSILTEGRYTVKDIKDINGVTYVYIGVTK